MMMNRLKPKPEVKGYLSLVLHAHLPYVRPHRNHSADNPWIYEALTETYLPLIEVMLRLKQDQIDFRFTFSMTSILLALLSDTSLRDGYRQYLDIRIRQSEEEQHRLQKDIKLLPIASLYESRYREILSLYDELNGDLIEVFKQYQEEGYLEIATSAATHGYLPLMKTEEAIKAQIATAVKDYKHHFDRAPRGIWLPECGYTPGLERIMKQFGLDYFIADSNAVDFAEPRPKSRFAAPVMTPYGVSGFPRNPEASEQLMSSEFGYPSDYDYRDYYQDTFKYYRNTSKGPHREPYQPDWAVNKAAQHAEHFLLSRVKQVVQESAGMDRKPIIIAAYPAELLGHWWYEGPIWLEALCRDLYHEQSDVKLLTPSEYLDEYPSADIGLLNESSWGRSNSADALLHGSNDWIYRHLHEAEERMIRLATGHEHVESSPNLSAAQLKRALNQAARELMLAQSSDWAFLMGTPSVAEYAIGRIKDHLGCFHHLCDMVERQQAAEELLAHLEQEDSILPLMDYRVYAAIRRFSPIEIIPELPDWEQLLHETKDHANVFMLAWEYPPKHVGGLSRSVHELSEALAAEGETVHVITTSHYGAPAFEKMNGVYVHRLPILCSGDTDFFDWTFEMNLAMIGHLVRYKEHGGRIDLLHAHDWMVMHTAREIKLSFGIPLVATIHATEWGRNEGRLTTELQHKIHHLEWQLTYEANSVFVCSHYMKNQVQAIYALPENKVHVFPNGIKQINGLTELSRRPHFLSQQDKVVFCISRLVYEKGVQVLIEAMPLILSQVPTAKLVIAGSGPMEEELRAKASFLGDRVWFTGFVGGTFRDSLYQAADVCVIPSLYEPFGIVALEAMAAKKPLVLSDTGGLAEIIQHGLDGFKALPGHIESLAWHVTELLLQPELGKKMADAAYHTLLRQYQWSAIAANMLGEYRKLTHDQPILIGVSGECKEGLAASFGLVFHPPEGPYNKRNTKQDV